MLNAKVIGNNIREARKKRELTIEALATEVDISENFLGKIERGDSFPSLTTVYNIAVALSVSIDSLLFDVDYNNTEFQYIKSLIEVNDLTKENRERFIDFINTNIKYFK